MIVKELAVERYIFSCPGCQAAWTFDYDVQHVEDGHGHQWDYFFRDGLPAVNPTVTRAVACPRCGRTQLYARLGARRATPLVDVAGQSGSGQAPDAELRRERTSAPPLGSAHMLDAERSDETTANLTT
jgi:hypothetical protein